MLVIRSITVDLEGVRASSSAVKLSAEADPALGGELGLRVEYPVPPTDPAGRDVWMDSEQRDWSAGRALSFRAKAMHPLKMSVSFFDRRRVVYTAWQTLEGSRWQRVVLPLDALRPNPYFQPPDAELGSALDVSEVKGIAFAPQDPEAGWFAVSRFSLLP